MPSTITDDDLSIPIPPYPVANAPRDTTMNNGDPPPQARNGQRFGHYIVIRTLGEGSFGKVKLAHHVTTGQKVALKIITRKKLANRDMAGRVEREIQYLQLLRHPHIIKLYSVMTTKEDIIMVMEYAGGELFDYIVTNGRMEENRSRRFFQQIICAVEYCHRHKIVHRDLKPENLLLDDTLNVKIADFGLSNIMTDGNFLKTSCGSPNYAAPEVISGKLYAGPEVDVWSCGVILYVMLCGRLPFDDDYIPSLFKKIAQGQYHIPTYLSHESVSLLKKMLVVNPVNRITVAEIRQDPWFLKGLPEYLMPAVQEFHDTGVDTSKLPQKKIIPPTPALHDSVVGKLSSTLGYGKDLLNEALSKEEPSAIKDAYRLVTDNEIMRRASQGSKAPESFLAQSPPMWSTSILGAASPPTIAHHMSPLNRAQGSPLAGTPTIIEHGPSIPGTPTAKLTVHGSDALTKDDIGNNPLPMASDTTLTHTSTVSILASSMPIYHKAYMEGGPDAAKQGQQPAAASTPGPNRKLAKSSLAPRHSALGESSRPNPLTPLQATPPAKKQRPTRWQFGIRSRNQPLDAVACIYRALRKLGAEWLVETDDDNRSYRSNESDNSTGDKPLQMANDNPNASRKSHTSSGSSEGQHGEDDEFPEDPWVIHSRWRKEGYRYTQARPGSAMSNISTASKSTRAYDDEDSDDNGVYVYMEIQLYQLESNFYLVDFKCAGYEQYDEDGNPLGMPQQVRQMADDLGAVESYNDPTRPPMMERTKSVRSTRSEGTVYGGWKGQDEKDVSSPFPFLDLAGKLIIQLAEAD